MTPARFHRRFGTLIASVLALALMAAACGGGDDSDPDAAPATATTTSAVPENTDGEAPATTASTPPTDRSR